MVQVEAGKNVKAKQHRRSNADEEELTRGSYQVSRELSFSHVVLRTVSTSGLGNIFGCVERRSKERGIPARTSVIRREYARCNTKATLPTRSSK